MLNWLYSISNIVYKAVTHCLKNTSSFFTQLLVSHFATAHPTTEFTFTFTAPFKYTRNLWNTLPLQIRQSSKETFKKKLMLWSHYPKVDCSAAGRRVFNQFCPAAGRPTSGGRPGTARF